MGKKESWIIRDARIGDEDNLVRETLFSLGNGYLGIRGTNEEGYYGSSGQTCPGTFLNGIYEYKPYQYIWKRPGFPERTHSMIQIPNPVLFSIFAGGDRVMADPSMISEYDCVLDMKSGILSRKYLWKSPQGGRLKLSFERFVSLAENTAAAFRVHVESFGFSGEVRVVSSIEGYVETEQEKKPEIGSFEKNPVIVEALGFSRNIGWVTIKTPESGFCITSAMGHISSAEGISIEQKVEQTRVTEELVFTLHEGEALCIDKIVCSSASKDNHCRQVCCSLQEYLAQGYDALKQRHIAAWHQIWQQSRMEITGDDDSQLAVRFSMFHLVQAAGRDGRTNISANGLTGEGYQGHTFWDTEIYMLPYFLYTDPKQARRLLEYRYRILDQARIRAAQLGERGALYAWNSITGEECGFVFEASTAQYHINCDIAYAVYQYMQAAGDIDFLLEYGAEILFETASCIAHRGAFIPQREGKFCINVVCGPDEYTPVVDNNCYTNAMAKFHLAYAYQTAAQLQAEHPRRFLELTRITGIDQDEIELWRRASDMMYIPYSRNLDILMQDDQFLYRDPVEVSSIPKDSRPLLTHLHPLKLWRLQAAKQADTVLLMVLLGHQYPLDLRRRVYDYYEPKTIHDSSLSPGVHSIAASEIGRMDDAWKFFSITARMDLDNRNGNTGDGIHAAAMGCTWMCVVFGFAGMRVVDSAVTFKPVIPFLWDSYRFTIRFQQRVLEVFVSRTSARYSLVSGEPLEISHSGEPLVLSMEHPREFPLDAPSGVHFHNADGK